MPAESAPPEGAGGILPALQLAFPHTLVGTYVSAGL